MNEPTCGGFCQACHAAQLIADALAIISPDDSTVFDPIVTGCGTLRVRVDSDDVGLYDVDITAVVPS